MGGVTAPESLAERLAVAIVLFHEARDVYTTAVRTGRDVTAAEQKLLAARRDVLAAHDEVLAATRRGEA